MALRIDHAPIAWFPSATSPKYTDPDARDLRLIEKGQVHLEDGPAAPAKVRVLETTDSGNGWRSRSPKGAPAHSTDLRPVGTPGEQAATRNLRDDFDS